MPPFLAIFITLAAAGLPNPSLTPGATTQVPLERLCIKGYTKTARHVSGQEKAAVYKRYGIPKSDHRRYEVDHLIPLELGGSNDIRNLWPQPKGTAVFSVVPGSKNDSDWNAHTKDALEDRLHELVCRHNPTISLNAAQQAIRTDWIAAYKVIFKTDVPLK